MTITMNAKKGRTVKTSDTKNFLVAALVSACAFVSTAAWAADPLPSWNESKAKEAIVAFR